MHDIPVMKDLIIIFLASIPIIFLFKKLGLPSIAGFLVTGILTGPYGFKLVTATENIEVMAEIGVILLLFTIGLEISISRLAQMKRYLLLAGGLQVGLTILLSFLIFYLTGISAVESIFSGMLISLSSTAIVLKLLSDKGELEAPHGRIAIGILIFQDLAVVPMMLLLPLLGRQAEVSASALLTEMLVAFGVLGLIILVSRVLMPKIVFHLAALRIREAFTIGIILLILSTAYLTGKAGLSLALGAFIAGLILAETDFTHQVVADIIPLKDAFNSLFFVSIGLLFNYTFVMEYPLLMLGLTAGIIAGKALVVFITIKILGYPARVGIMAALSLAQIGEFSFVLAQAGIEEKLIPAEFYNAFLASSIFTMLLTPIFLKLAPVIAMRFKNIDSGMKSMPDMKAMPEMKDHVIIAGFGINGQNIARVLGETGIRYLILELNPHTVKKYKANGENIFYGDITRREVLHQTGIEQASIIVFAISDAQSTRIGISLARELNPSIYCIVRTRYLREVDEFIRLGADEVIPEEFETSLQIFSKVLQRYHIPLNVIMKQTNIIRSESYGILRQKSSGLGALSHLDKILAEGVTETYFVEDTNPNIGRSLRDLNIRALTGSTIIAVLRREETITNPPGTEKLKAGDTLVIYGTHNAVDKGITLLNG